MKIVEKIYKCSSIKKIVHKFEKGYDINKLSKPCGNQFTLDGKQTTKVCPKCGFGNKIKLIQRNVY